MTSAVVIGAGMAGLSMARALADHFDRVTVVDRDAIPDAAVQRRGVPQDRHLHLLLPAGADALEQLFPGLLDELVDGGAAAGDTDRIRVCLNGHRLATTGIGRRSIFATRPFVEAQVRRRLARNPRVEVRTDCHVAGLVASQDQRRITGVELRPGPQGPPERLDADLVIDCSGRRSSAPRWLARLGYAVPQPEELPVDVRYVTRRYRLPAGALAGDRHVLVGPTPDVPCGGAMTNVEDGSWLVTLFAMAGERVPADREGFERFAGGLPITDIHDAVRSGATSDEPAHYRYPANRRHPYERADRLPAGLLVAGDALCSFNPIYGQGMSVAALEAVVLRGLLAGGAPPEPHEWLSAIAPVVETAWDLATGADLAIRSVQGRRGPEVRALGWYVARLHAAATADAELAGRFLRVASLVDKPTLLLRPATVARVIGGTLRQLAMRPGAPRSARAQV